MWQNHDFYFSEILRKTIIEQIAAIVVLPNKIIVPLSEEVPMETLKIPEPEVNIAAMFHMLYDLLFILHVIENVIEIGAAHITEIK